MAFMGMSTMHQTVTESARARARSYSSSSQVQDRFLLAVHVLAVNFWLVTVPSSFLLNLVSKSVLHTLHSVLYTLSVLF